MQPTVDVDMGFARNIAVGGVHSHHVVLSVILVMVSVGTMLTLQVDGGVPEFTATSIFFGVGAAVGLVVTGLDILRSDDAKVEASPVLEIRATPAPPDRIPGRQEVS